jgi:hypothetical protein
MPRLAFCRCGRYVLLSGGGPEPSLCPAHRQTSARETTGSQLPCHSPAVTRSSSPGLVRAFSAAPAWAEEVAAVTGGSWPRACAIASLGSGTRRLRASTTSRTTAYGSHSPRSMDGTVAVLAAGPTGRRGQPRLSHRHAVRAARRRATIFGEWICPPRWFGLRKRRRRRPALVWSSARGTRPIRHSRLDPWTWCSPGICSGPCLTRTGRWPPGPDCCGRAGRGCSSRGAGPARRHRRRRRPRTGSRTPLAERSRRRHPHRRPRTTGRGVRRPRPQRRPAAVGPTGTRRTFRAHRPHLVS